MVEKVEAESVMVVWVLVMSGDRGGGHGEGGGNDGEGGSGDHEVGCEVGDSEVGDSEVGDSEVGDGEVGDSEVGDGEVGDGEGGCSGEGDADRLSDDADRLGIMVNRCDDNRGENNC